MTTLFITGNGFDIAHELKTQYNDFRQYVASRRSELTSYNGEFGISISLVQEQFQRLCLPDELWSNFETQTIKIINEIQNGKNINLFGNTYSASSVSNLETWVDIRKKITNILEEQTGKAGLSSEMHTTRFKEMRKASRDNGIKSSGSSESYDANIGRFYKPVHQLVNKINTFLEHKDFDEIFVIGHSYNEIDVPYFKELFKNYPDKSYIFTYYSKEDETNVASMIDNIGLITNYKIVNINDYFKK
ncbi:hypothetical protein AB996_1187 [Lactococcus cremoris]|uniref:Uncharacterized protein n=1 Tax=Lactococcus lactis subsp. cremoris TaxID=1359 RepID=A0A166JM79_LACLC|nr:AbiH family protein [Lactococcus cremoris]KZK06411.1 hypothetical protein AB996_1187 [Lactococcus cremoris]